MSIRAYILSRFCLFIVCCLAAGWLNGQTLSFNLSSGFYLDSIWVEVDGSGGHQIRYTLDGSNPSPTSQLYTGPFWISDRSGQANRISGIRTNPPNIHPSFAWHPPAGHVLKSTIVKAALFNQSDQVGSIVSGEFFIGPELANIDLPVVSIHADSIGLFGYEKGIYVPGKDYDEGPNSWQPGNYYNEGSEWEREATLYFYEAGLLQLRQTFELKTHGGGSRMMPCKSLRLSAKQDLGTPFFDYPFFTDRNINRYKRLVLRNGGQDFVHTHFADVLMHALLVPTGIGYQAAKQAVVFLNGEYWGIHDLRERYDKYYLESNFGTDLNAVDLVETAMAYEAKEGNSDGYVAMMESLKDADLSQSDAYDALAAQVDLNSFIDHHISKTYGGGDDWAGNNELVWRPHTTGAVWRWLAVDYDDCFFNIDKDAYGHATNDSGETWPNPAWSTLLFRKLMENKAFAVRYKQRLRQHLDTTFSPSRVLGKIDSIAAIYRPEMPRQVYRWGYPQSLADWEANVEHCKTFARERPAVLWQNFNTYFPDIYLNPARITIVPNPASDWILVDLPPSMGETAHYRLFASNGAIIASDTLSHQFQNRIKVTGLASGLYFLQIKTGEMLLTERVLVR